MLARVLPTAEYALLHPGRRAGERGLPAGAGRSGRHGEPPAPGGRPPPAASHPAVRSCRSALALRARSACWATDTRRPWPLMVLVSTMAGGALLVAGGQFQSEQRFGISLTLNQSPNLMLLLAALWVVLAGGARRGGPAAGVDPRLRRHGRGRLVGALPRAAREAASLDRVSLGRGLRHRRAERGGPAADPARAAADSASAAAGGPGDLRRAGGDRGVALPGAADGRRLLAAAAPAGRGRTCPSAAG